MSIFNNYDKPGKGVEKNEPPKLAVVVFFETAVRKFGKLVKSGCLFSLLSIPWLLILYAGAYFILYMPISLVTAGMEAAQSSLMTSMICSAMAMLVVVLWGSGPLSAAFSFVMRAFVREEPIWLISDSKKMFKENIRQGFAVLFIDAAVLVLSSFALELYWALQQSMQGGAVVMQIMRYLLIVMLLIYTMMHPYIYQLMITFECSVSQLYKNALFLTLAKLPLNFLLMLIAAAVIIVPVWFFGIYPLFAGLAVLSIGYVLTRFPSEFYAVLNIKREMLEK